jgi:hypothetical protein
MKRIAVVLVLLTILLPGVCLAGPFGFERGMTKDQIIAIVGKDAVIKDQGYVLRVIKAPKPDSAFEAYTLLISPDKGLLKIIAAGQTIDSSPFGTETQVEFSRIRHSIIEKYGAPTQDYDFVQPNSRLAAPSDWMASLLKKDRKLAAGWDLSEEKHKSGDAKQEHLSSILVESMGLKINAGWVQVSYEFEGFDEFYETVNKK